MTRHLSSGCILCSIIECWKEWNRATLLVFWRGMMLPRANGSRAMVVMVVRSMAGVSTMLPMVPDWFPRSPIRRSVGRSTCGHRPGRNPPSRFYALRTHIVVSAAYRPFAQGVFYNALVSVADHLQYLLRSRGHMCSAELLLQEGKFLVHSY